MSMCTALIIGLWNHPNCTKNSLGPLAYNKPHSSHDTNMSTIHSIFNCIVNISFNESTKSPVVNLLLSISHEFKLNQSSPFKVM